MKPEPDDTQITLDIPQREGKEGYIGTFFTLYLKLGTLLSGGSFNSMDYHVTLLVEMIVSTVPGKKREAIRQRIKDRLANETSSNQSLDEKQHTTTRIYIEELAAVTDFIDEHIGLSNEHKIGIV